MFRPTLTLVSLIGLAACGGGSTSTFGPISSEGYATDASFVGLDSRFSVPDTPRLIGEDDVVSSERQTIQFNILSAEERAVELTIDGDTYVLPFLSGGSYELVEGENEYTVSRVGERFSEAEIISVFAVDEGRLNSGLVVIGYDTDPAAVSRRSGSATMDGQLFLAARNGLNIATGTGDVSFTVDFDSNTIGGTGSVGPTGSDIDGFEVPALDFAFSEVAIGGNGFSGAVTVTGGDVGGTLSGARYDGRLYGSDAAIAGGSIAASVDVPELEDDTFIAGAFLAGE